MMEQGPIRVLIVGAYPAVRAGLRAMLESREGIELVGDSPRLAVGAPEATPADVVVVDLDRESEFILDSLEGDALETPIVMLASEPEIYQELAPGDPRPAAYLLRSADGEDIVAAVRAVARGLMAIDPAVGVRGVARPAVHPEGNGVGQLTERELEVLRLLAEGLPNKAIALKLGISEHTVKFHVGSILSRLNAGSRTEAVMLAARRGLLPL